MKRSIVLISADADLLPVDAAEVGFLFESALDGSAWKLHPGAIGLTQLIGEFERVKADAYGLAKRLLAGEPQIRGTRQLGVFEELVIRELQRAFHVLHLHDFLVAHEFTHCQFAGDADLATGLAHVAAQLGSGLTITSRKSAHRWKGWASVRRSWQRVRSAGFDRRAAAREWRQILERLDPYHRRERAKSAWSQQKDGAIWFYTTAHTFTRIGQYYEPYFPQTFEYLIEDPRTGGEPLRAAGRPFTSVYAFGSREMEPSTAELASARQLIVSHLKSVCLTPRERLALGLLFDSSFFDTFLSRHLPSGLYATSLFKHWVNTTRPEALVVGNPVFEAYALHAAKQQSIPTILLQHGILGDYCQFSDPPVTHLVVRGTFWRDFLASAARGRAHVLAPADAAPPREKTPSRDAMLFLTAPYRAEAFLHVSDLDDILAGLLAVAVDAGRELIIRVHPMEEVGFYEQKIRKWVQAVGVPAKVTYSQGTPIDDLLVRACVAVTYCSTVFLDCLRYGVPIVSYAWHDFSYKRHIEAHDVFHFAADLSDLAKLVRRALVGDLPAYALSTRPFLAETSDGELREALANISQALMESERRAAV